MNLIQMLNTGPVLSEAVKKEVILFTPADAERLELARSLGDKFTARSLADALGVTGDIPKEVFRWLTRMSAGGRIAQSGLLGGAKCLRPRKLWSVLP